MPYLYMDASRFVFLTHENIELEEISDTSIVEIEEVSIDIVAEELKSHYEDLTYDDAYLWASTLVSNFK